MSTARTPSTRRARGSRGQTLFEVIAVTTILGIVLVMVYGGIDSATKALGGTEKRLANLDEARILMAVSTKDVRTATRLQAGTSPFTLADNREVIFYANLNNNASECAPSCSVVDTGPRRVRIYVDAGSQLIEEVTKPASSSVPPNYLYTGTATRRFVGRYVANTTEPIFKFFDTDGDPLTATPLSTTDRLAVSSVQITLSIRRSTTFPIASTTLRNTVRLPNVDYQETFG